MSVYEILQTVSKEKENFNESCTNNKWENEHLGCTQSKAQNLSEGI